MNLAKLPAFPDSAAPHDSIDVGGSAGECHSRRDVRIFPGNGRCRLGPARRRADCRLRKAGLAAQRRRLVRHAIRGTLPAHIWSASRPHEYVRGAAVDLDQRHDAARECHSIRALR
jgi:hypothetical protein